MFKTKAPKGTYIVLKRRHALPDAPEAEAGPAAIIQVQPTVCLGVGIIVRNFLLGWDHYPWTGVKTNAEQSVLVLSPWVPEEVFVHRFLETEIDWRQWDGGALPATDADVIVVWLPRIALPRMKLRAAADHLLAEAFGGGAVYTVRGFDGEIHLAEVAHV